MDVHSTKLWPSFFPFPEVTLPPINPKVRFPPSLNLLNALRNLDWKYKKENKVALLMLCLNHQYPCIFWAKKHYSHHNLMSLTSVPFSTAKQQDNLNLIGIKVDWQVRQLSAIEVTTLCSAQPVWLCGFFGSKNMVQRGPWISRVCKLSSADGTYSKNFGKACNTTRLASRCWLHSGIFSCCYQRPRTFFKLGGTYIFEL